MRHDFESLMFMRDGGNVARSHTLRVVGPHQSVAHHSHGVACLLLWLYAHDQALPKPTLLAAALCHDLSEVTTGDMPATAKWASPELRSALHEVSSQVEAKWGVRFYLNEAEKLELRFCDITEFALWSIEQIRMGNSYAKTYLNNATLNIRGYDFKDHPRGDHLERLRGIILSEAKKVKT